MHGICCDSMLCSVLPFQPMMQPQSAAMGFNQGMGVMQPNMAPKVSSGRVNAAFFCQGFV